MFILASENKELAERRQQNPFSLTSGGFTITQPSNEQQGKPVKVERFLPEDSASSYINVRPGDLRDIKIVSAQVLGEDAKTINEILHTKLLHFKVLALTTNGDEIWSPEASLSQRIGEDEAGEIRRKVLGK
jgi:hypothetical protein